jgi:hypothetical protein
MAKGCWCTLKSHLPGERKRHQKAHDDARRMLGLPDDLGKSREVQNDGRSS